MAASDELDRDLGGLKNRGYTLATVTYENLDSSGERDHRVGWKRLADPWEARAFKNRLESTWRQPPFIGAGGEQAFPVEEKSVESGSGKTQLKWNVWVESSKLNTIQVELYSVMRAEDHYIGQGFTKIASKYYSEVGPGKIPVENCGVDSFFKKGGTYVVCESKFTGDEMKFGKLKENEERVWALMTKYKGVRQMTWDWIEDRAKKACKSPPTKLAKRTEQQKAAIRAEVNEMRKAVLDRTHVARVVNIYGSASVPIYPGRYRFRCGERAAMSQNVLHLKWELDIDATKEFVTLDHRFDKWADDRA